MNERDLRTRHLPRRALSTQLPHCFNQQQQSVHPRMAIRKPAAIGVHWQIPARRNAAGCGERAAFAFGAEPEVFEKQDRVDRERVIQLAHIDVGRMKPSHPIRGLSRFHSGRRRQIPHALNLVVTDRVADAEHIHRRLSQRAGALGRRQDHRAAAVGHQAAVANAQRCAHHPRSQDVSDRQR